MTAPVKTSLTRDSAGVPANPIILIPARLQSARLPNKPLAEIAGAPMIVQVMRRAEEAALGRVVVACAEAEIADAVSAAGGEAVLTRADHVSGSDRIFEALMQLDPDGAHDAVINVQGRVFMPEGLDSPFVAADRLLAELEADPPAVTLVDFHTEATSEQAALGWYLDGRVSAVVGTHTHVPTADAKILPRGTAFVTDLGMTGPVHSIIGSRVEDVLTKFLTAMPRRLNVADDPGPAQFNSVLIDVDERTGLANSIERVDRTLEA